MADFDLQEMNMFARWHGTTNLVANESFWEDCGRTYVDKVVTLPVDDTPLQRRQILEHIKCPPGVCGACCRYPRVAITRDEFKMLSANVRRRIATESDQHGGLYLKTAGGCQFLRQNTCLVYPYRPGACRAFPVLEPRQTLSADSVIFRQLQIMLRCLSALEAVRTILSQVCSGGKLMILPDLSVIPNYENARAAFNY